MLKVVKFSKKKKKKGDGLDFRFEDYFIIFNGIFLK